MRIISILRASTLALALVAVTSTAFAASTNEVVQSPQSQNYSAGPYDGADFQAAKHAFN